MLFAFPASDATIAAVNAAKATPFNPAGNRFIRLDKHDRVLMTPFASSFPAETFHSDATHTW